MALQRILCFVNVSESDQTSGNILKRCEKIYCTRNHFYCNRDELIILERKNSKCNFYKNNLLKPDAFSQYEKKHSI